MTLWGGRFQKSLDKDAEKLSFSFEFDCRLYKQDIKVNLVHAKALQKAEILTATEFQKVQKCLLSISEKDIHGTDEDVHSCIERLLTERLGDLGKKIHTGKSRNDQVITDVRLYLKEELQTVLTLIESLLHRLWSLSKDNLDQLFPGFTHFQPAQPVLLAHHFLAHFEQFERDKVRFQDTFKRTDVCPLGSGALAGNNYKLDREFVAKELGFSQVSQNSMDAVSDRDFILDFLSAASICMTHLSQFCEELIIWSSPFLGFISIGDEFTTGSSIMPQKKNPDIAELIRGKSGRVLGHFVGLQHTLKALPLTYNRDLQEDKNGMFDTIDTLKSILVSFEKMLGSTQFHSEAIRSALDKGYLLATEIADYLAFKGVPFRDAHELTGKIVIYAIENNRGLESLSIKELQQFSNQIENDILDWLDNQKAVDRKDVIGGTATSQVQVQLNRIEETYQWKKR